LKFAENKIIHGERDPNKIVEEMKAMILANDPAGIDYVEIVDAETLETKRILNGGETVLIPLAVRFGATRLIDNTIVTIQ
jgi:pantoate--beta-alanine ligase